MKKESQEKVIVYLLTVAVTVFLSFFVKLDISNSAILSNAELSGGYEISDFYNSVGRIISEKQQAFCEDVIIVNIDDCEIDNLPTVINKIDSLSPKVIGVDILFKKHADSIDRMIVDAIKNCNSAVLARETDDDCKQVLASPVFRDEDALYGIVDVEEPITRHYWPQFQIGDSIINSFALELVKQYSTEKYNKQLIRKKASEHICIANDFSCYILNYKRLLNVDEKDKTLLPQIIEGKIVIVGSIRDKGDMHMTSINRELPGTTIHAAIIHTILEEDYVNEYLWFNYFIATVIILGFAWLVVKSKNKNKAWVNLFLRVLQIGMLFIGAYLGSLLYIEKHIYIDLSVTLLSVGLVYVGYDIAFAIYTFINRLINNKKA